MVIYDILAKIMSYLWVYIGAHNYVELDHNLVPRRIAEIDVEQDLPAHTYVELDHNLVPRNIKDINERNDLPGREKPARDGLKTFMVHKYELKKDNMKIVLDKFTSLEYRKKNEA